jgi:hypothetical protein
MKTKPLPYLCGGIFLVLLTEAKGKAASRRQLRSGKKDRVSNRNMLEALIQMVVPSFQQPLAGRTFEGDTATTAHAKSHTVKTFLSMMMLRSRRLISG